MFGSGIVLRGAAHTAACTKATALKLFTYRRVVPVVLAIGSRPFGGEPPSAPRVPLRHQVYDDIKGWLIWRLKLARRGFYALAIVGLCAGAFVWRTQGPHSGKANILSAIERGVVAGDWSEDDGATVERSELHDQLLRVLRPHKTRQYVVVVGEHGTGKSTAVRKAARSAGVVNGVVYYSVAGTAKFSTDLAVLLGRHEGTVDVQGGLRRYFSQITKEEKQPLLVEEPLATWLTLQDELQEAAAAFRTIHGRPATLVLDGIDAIAKEAPSFLDKLQDFAKAAADAGVLRVVFVSSDGTAPARLRSRPEWSRAAYPVEVGDITDAQAVDFLVKSNGTNPTVAALIVDRIAGGRFELLVRHSTLSDEAAVVAVVKELEQDLSDALEGLSMPSDHAYFKAITSSSRADSDARRAAGISLGQRDALLKANIIAAHSDRSVTFHSRFVQRYFEKAFAAGTGASA